MCTQYIQNTTAYNAKTASKRVKPTLAGVEFLLILFLGIGILANVVVIAVVAVWEKLQKHRTIANVFVINLAIADLLFLAVLPLHMPLLIDRGWTFGTFLCKFTEGW